MHLEEFTFIPAEAKEKTLRFLANLTGDPSADSQRLMAQVELAFVAAAEAREITYLSEAGGETPDTALFRTGLTTPTGEEIYGKCSANRKPGARHKWFGLFFQAARREGFTISDMYFRTWTEGQRFLEEVAAMALPERWSYNQYQSRQTHPILKSFLEHTLERLKAQDRIVKAGGQALFNTGLIDRYFKEVYVVCEINPDHPGRLENPRPVLENDRILLTTFRNTKPPMARWFSQITDVVFDPDLDVVTNDIHIIDENFDRIPAEYQAMRKAQIFALFQSAIDFARVMAARNYKLIVPHVYHGTIQFLMPIYLSGEFAGAPDFALVLERIGNAYRGNTILTLDMAYQNARLIAKPEAAWLTVALEGERQP